MMTASGVCAAHYSFAAFFNHVCRSVTSIVLSMLSLKWAQVLHETTIDRRQSGSCSHLMSSQSKLEVGHHDS